VLVASMISGVTAGLAGFAARKVLNFTSVQASAAIALIAGLVLPRLFNDGSFLAAVCTCVSYAVMSSEEVIHTPLQMAAVSCLCTGIAVFGRDALVGVGGRLGSMAAMAVLAFLGLRFFIRRSWHSSKK